MKGQILLTYRDNDLTRPEGLTATDDGHVLICGWTSDTVQVVSKNGKILRTLQCKQNGFVSTTGSML